MYLQSLNKAASRRDSFIQNMPRREPRIEAVKLKGHQQSVLCLDHSSSRSALGGFDAVESAVAGCLLSGSQDGTARLWDLRADSNLRASLCIQGPVAAEVLSVTFGPNWTSPLPNPETTSCSSPFARQYSVYLAMGNSVYGYDLRLADKPIWSHPSADLSFMGAEDEINQIAFAPLAASLQKKNKKGKKTPCSSRDTKHIIASVDDAGSVRVTDTIELPEAGEAKAKSRTYRHGDMVTSLAFRPRVKNGAELASGGTNCQIQLWDVTKERSRPWSTITIPNSDAGANQVCNPPMVNSLNWSPSGRLLVASLGDGSIGVLQAENRSLVMVERIEDAHSGAVASTIFPRWQNSSMTVNAQDRLLCSSGNDGAVVLWDMGSSLCGNKAQDPSEMFFGTDDGKCIDASMQSMELAEQPKALFAWNHGAKPNWMVSSNGQDPAFPSSLFIADTTNEISVYTVR